MEDIKSSNVELQAQTFPRCSCLGTLDSSNKCVCENGWTGTECNNLNLDSITESPSGYNSAVYTNDRPTWGGSIIEGDGTYFFVGSTFPNSRGLSCWPDTSMLAIWEAENLNGPWTPVSFVGFGNYPGYKAEDVPWNHNAMVTVESKLANPEDPNSTIKYALAIYSIMKRPKTSYQMSSGNFGPPNNKICSTRWAKPFPVDKFDQETHVAYVELNATNEQDIKKEITNLLHSKQLVANVNGYDRSEYVNTEFSWVNLKYKIPNPPINMVNPYPLISYATNFTSLISDPNGQYYKMLAVRFAKDKEVIGLLKLRANKFIWETDAKYSKGHLVSFGWNIEDPFFFESANGYHLIVHDGRTCGLWNSCGSITHYPKNVTGYNILADSNWSKPTSGWAKPTKLYNNVIPSLKTPTAYRQRPSLFFKDQRPTMLLNGTIFAASSSTSKANRTFTAPISR